MKSMSWYKNEILHIETTLGIINVLPGLVDHAGRRVVSIEVLPDRSIGGKKVICRGYINTRLIELKTVKAK